MDEEYDICWKKKPPLRPVRGTGSRKQSSSGHYSSWHQLLPFLCGTATADMSYSSSFTALAASHMSFQLGICAHHLSTHFRKIIANSKKNKQLLNKTNRLTAFTSLDPDGSEGIKCSLPAPATTVPFHTRAGHPQPAPGLSKQLMCSAPAQLYSGSLLPSTHPNRQQ